MADNRPVIKQRGQNTHPTSDTLCTPQKKNGQNIASIVQTPEDLEEIFVRVLVDEDVVLKVQVGLKNPRVLRM